MNKLFLLPAFLFVLSISNIVAQKTQVVEVKKICEGLTKSQKPTVAVMPFKVSVNGANQALGTGLSDMLADAI